MATNARGRATRDRLLDAAEQVFVEDGWGLSVERVAAVAGVVRTNVYHHFDSRDALLTAMALRSAQRIGSRLTGVLDTDAAWEDRLVEVVVTIVTEVRTIPHLRSLVAGGEVTSRWPEVDPNRQLIEGAIDFLRPWLVRAGAEGLRLRVPVEDALDWILRTTVMQLTVPGLGGDTEARLRYETRMLVLPAIVET